MNIFFAVLLFIVGIVCLSNALVHGIMDPLKYGLKPSISGSLIVLSMAAAAFAGGYILIA